jgi:hypothetical protein
MAERVDRLVEHDATRMQHYGAVANPFSLVEVVSGEHDSCSGLIEKDDVRSGSQRKGKRETLALSP